MTINTPEQGTATAPGWYPIVEHPGRQGYWDGRQWTQFHDVSQVPSSAPAVAVGNHAPVQQVVVHTEGRKRVNHLLHLFLTIITAGLWLPVWIVLAIAKS